eukprot:6447967-Amphidinium_carterae.1
MDDADCLCIYVVRTVKLEDVKWHHGRHELFDELQDQCACKVERLDEGGRSLDGEVRALPCLPEGVTPPLAIAKRVVMAEETYQFWLSASFSAALASGGLLASILAPVSAFHCLAWFWLFHAGRVHA